MADSHLHLLFAITMQLFAGQDYPGLFGDCGDSSAFSTDAQHEAAIDQWEGHYKATGLPLSLVAAATAWLSLFLTPGLGSRRVVAVLVGVVVLAVPLMFMCAFAVSASSADPAVGMIVLATAALLLVILRPPKPPIRRILLLGAAWVLLGAIAVMSLEMTTSTFG